MVKILFLDIDGVVNNAKTFENPKNLTNIESDLASLVKRIIKETKCEVVLSSSWRHMDFDVNRIEKYVCPVSDKTPSLKGIIRGEEIQAWLDDHPEVIKYAILDDDADMLPHQMPNLFQTDFSTGLTKEIADKIIQHLNEK